MASSDLEIVFELRRKNKLLRDDKANIVGIVDAADTCSSWPVLKSYLAQSIGATEDISVAYVDDRGDEVPIETDSDFRALLEFSRSRASKGQRIVLTIDKPAAMGKYGFRYVDEDADETPPAWFAKYMEKFQEKLIDAVVDTIIELDETREKKRLGKIIFTAKSRDDDSRRGKEHRRKKSSQIDDDSGRNTKPTQTSFGEVVGACSSAYRQKIERILDAKLSKIENRSRRTLEKRSKHERHSSRKAAAASLKRSHAEIYRKIDPDLFVAPKPEQEKKSAAKREPDDAKATLGMGATPLSDCVVNVYVKKGEIVTYKWQVMNTGLYRWCEDTELRYTWGCSALVPLDKTVKCPKLKPGETGFVEIALQAPTEFGSFESYWYFFHDGVRFGQWLNLNCIVSPSEFPTDRAVDLTKKIEPEGGYEAYDSDSDDISVISGTISGDSSERDEYVVVRMPDEKIVVDGVEIVTKENEYPTVTKIQTTLNEMKIEEAAAVVEEERPPAEPAVAERKVVVDEPVEERRDAEAEPNVDAKPNVDAEIVYRFNYIIDNFNSLSDASIYEFLDYADAALAGDSIVDEKKRKIIKKQARVLRDKLDARVNPRPTIPLSYPDEPERAADGRHFTFTSSGAGFESSSRPKRPSPPPPYRTQYSYVFRGGDDPIPTRQPNVNIIPETLIEGAVNAASSAYNTAKNVFGIFRIPDNSDQMNQFANSNWRYESRRPRSPPPPAELPRRSMNRCLDILSEMGFNNRSLNVKLLRRYDNDLPTVISKLI